MIDEREGSGGGGSEGFPQAESPDGFPQDERPIGARAAASAARGQNPQNSGDKSESAVRRSTVARSTEARLTVARSTVPRSDAALSLRDTNTSSLRSEVTSNQTRPDLTSEVISPADADADSGRVGSGRDDLPPSDHGAVGVAGAAPSAPPAPATRSAASPPEARSAEPAPVAGSAASPAEADHRPADDSARSDVSRLLAACLPSWMRAMDADGAALVAGLLVERLRAGWPAGEIRRVMDAPPPSEPIRRMSSFVAWRLRDDVDPALAPRADGDGRPSEVERQEATRRRSEAIAEPERRDVDPRWAEAWAQVVAELPDASRLDQAQATRELLETGVDVSVLRDRVHARAQQRVARAAKRSRSRSGGPQ
ncbi:Hypothetical protein AAM4_2118 [Actinomyces succiniciruminis]|uniref:Uncharacterized protein n=2 Tax=Actinomyces succiniciruminis TaxID=1522002 RepID=A0A1L7RP08_9ACTO|nr:Hypothetical protein AAM4_2118 [Actinomyces succiniciruminis]